MDEDRLEEILDRARGSGHRDKLVEFGRRRGAHPSSTWWWSSGRVRAVITPRKVALAREYGAGGDGPGIRLDHDELRAVARLCRLWERVRYRWASFDMSSAGLPGSVARDFVYQPPGKNATPVVVGGVRMGHRLGKDFVGEDELVPIPRPVRATDGVTNAEIWRRGERQGPKTGSLVGVRYHLGGDLVVDARREELTIVRARRGALLVLECGAEDERFPWRTRDEVVIEEDEAPFVRALVRAVAREARQAAISPRARAPLARAPSRSAGTALSPLRRG